MTHIPVLLEPILNSVRQSILQGDFHSPQWMLDGTFGRGGHTRALLDEFPQLKILGLDQDAEAISYGESHFSFEMESGRLALMRVNFADYQTWGVKARDCHQGHGFDLILLDLGVSSPQLDRGERGFSFYENGPLDMRMDQRGDLQASDIVNSWSREDLSELFRSLGEVRRPHRVVDSIVAERSKHPFSTTLELATLIEKCEGWRQRGRHPATQYFLALRIAVNQELEIIQNVLPHLISALGPSGRLYIITFHSLEDRIVKYLLRDHLDQGFLVNKKVIQPTWSEAKENPRARSAKLRIFQKLSATESSTFQREVHP